MHLLYARFFTKVIRDLGLIDFNEPFLRLFNQGTVLSDHTKMSKSRGNVIAPDDYTKRLGADVVRLYLMFMGPWEGGGDWSDSGINGVARWVNRLWDLSLKPLNNLPLQAALDRELLRKMHQTIKNVITDYDRFKYNTAIAAMMELTNSMAPAYEKRNVSQKTWNELVSTLLLLIAPMAPHVSEELWELIGNEYSIHQNRLPEWDEELCAVEEATLVIQVNGKVRDKIAVPALINEGDAKNKALASPRIQEYTENKDIVKIVFVPNRYLLSIVTT